MVVEQDARVQSMFNRDRFAAIISVCMVWAVYAFVFFRMYDHFAQNGVQWIMVALGGTVLFLNTAAVVALIHHYQEDKAAIYGADIYYLDRIAAEKRAAR